MSFDELLRRSDVVSIHVPLTDETRRLFQAETFAKMKPGSLLLNTARGPIVDEVALTRALENGPLAGAGLDVYENEPAITPALLDDDRVVLMPHAGQRHGRDAPRDGADGRRGRPARALGREAPAAGAARRRPPMKTAKPKKSSFSPLDAAADGLLRRMARGDNALAWLQARWGRIVGEPLSRKIEPTALHGPAAHGVAARPGVEEAGRGHARRAREEARDRNAGSEAEGDAEVGTETTPGAHFVAGTRVAFVTGAIPSSISIATTTPPASRTKRNERTASRAAKLPSARGHASMESGPAAIAR